MIVVLFVLTGCGYRFSPGGEHIDPGIRKVFLEPFGNRTSEANVEDTFRLAMTDQFVKGKRFQIVDGEDEADALVRGTVKALATTPLSYRTTNLAAEERMTLTVELTFEERRTRKIIWKDENFTGAQEYPVASLSDTETSRKNALSKLANDTAERAYRMLMSGF
ncbi:MAG: LptE family protein [Syntrophobacterales bacterium]|nr:LptE family protein [Syntrophobacterales bacterium]